MPALRLVFSVCPDTAKTNCKAGMSGQIVHPKIDPSPPI
jgi:hypothetical protein